MIKLRTKLGKLDWEEILLDAASLMPTRRSGVLGSTDEEDSRFLNLSPELKDRSPVARVFVGVLLIGRLLPRPPPRD